MYVIGLTGGIASGKSTVVAMLAEKGAAIVSADEIGWEVYRPGGPAYQEVSAAFGPDILAADGNIDRKKLGPSSSPTGRPWSGSTSSPTPA